MRWPQRPASRPCFASRAKSGSNDGAMGGKRALKRVFYQAAFCSLQAPDSRAYYQRKRQEGKGYHQVVIALARRRVDVLWAMLRGLRPYQLHFKTSLVDKSD